MAYLDELRRNARSLAAASLGAGSGLMLMSYTTTLFGPHLVREFGWSRAQFALIGLAMFSTLVALPMIGRLTDRFGVRATAMVGALGIPACLLGYNFMNGSFLVYFLLSCALLALGSFTSPVVYTRLVAADFVRARGLALTIVTIAPAVLGAIAAPILAGVIDAWGWRAGYRVLAIGVLLCSLAAVALVPPGDPANVPVRAQAMALVRGDLRLIFGSGPFWILFFAMLLCTLQTPLHASQMGMMLADNQLGAAAVAGMISVYGMGTIFGRLACGLALDRFSAPIVAAISMLPPVLGYVLLGLPLDQSLVIGFAMFLVGLAVGAEGDLQSFLVARHFHLRIYSTTLSLVYCAVFIASALGAMLLSITLRHADSFVPFLYAVATTTLVGSLLFLLLPREGSYALIGETPDDAAAEPRGTVRPALEMS